MKNIPNRIIHVDVIKGVLIRRLSNKGSDAGSFR